MYIVITWAPLTGAAAADVAGDIEQALDPDGFEPSYSPFTGLHMACVKRDDLGSIRDLGQTLLILADNRFAFVMSYVPNGNYMYCSDDVDGDQCDALSGY